MQTIFFSTYARTSENNRLTFSITTSLLLSNDVYLLLQFFKYFLSSFYNSVWTIDSLILKPEFTLNRYSIKSIRQPFRLLGRSVGTPPSKPYRSKHSHPSSKFQRSIINRIYDGQMYANLLILLQYITYFNLLKVCRYG